MFFRSSPSSRKPASRLHLEALEDRSLLSANFGWAVGFGPEVGGVLDRQIATDNVGNVYMSGQAGATPVNLNPNGSYLLSNTLYLAKYNAAGNFLWANAGVGGHLAVDSVGNVFGQTQVVDGAGGSLVKLDPNGNTLWSTNLGQSLNLQNPYTSIAVDAAGNVSLTGANTFNQVWVAKLQGANGAVAWEWQPTGGVTNIVSSGGLENVAVDGAGNVYVTGSFNGTVNFNPGPNPFTLTSYDTNVHNSGGDAYVVKLNPNGGFVWAGQLGTDGGTYSHDLGVDSSGNVIVTGQFYAGTKIDNFNPGSGTYALTASGGSNIFVVKLDTNSNFQWGESISSAYAAQEKALAVDSSGAVYLTGLFSNALYFDATPSQSILTSPGVGSAYLLKLDTAGNLDWAAGQIETSAAPDRAWGFAVTVDPLGDVYESGIFNGTVNFAPAPGSDDLTSSGSGANTDYFLLKLTQQAEPSFSITGSTSVTAGTAGSFILTALNADGTPDTGYSGTVQFASSDGKAILPGNLTISGGTGAFNVTLETAGTQSISASDVSNPSMVGFDSGIAVSPAAASQVVFTQGPGNVTAGQTLGTVRAAIEDAYGNVETSDNSDQVTLGVNTGPSTQLGGTLTETVAAGNALFSNLLLDTSGTYTLAALANLSGGGTLGPVVSSSFTVASPVALSFGSITYNSKTKVYSETVTFTNSGSGPLTGPMSLALTNLPSGVVLTNSTGTTNGTPYYRFLTSGKTLTKGSKVNFTLTFTAPSLSSITFGTEVVVGL